MERKQEILDFIKAQGLMSIATISDAGTPQAAVVGFGETDELQLFFRTSNKSRKYQNLQANPQVAIVIWGGPKTIQYEGIAKEMAGAEAQKYTELYYAKNPGARKYKMLEDDRLFLIEPKWLRFTDVSASPWDIVELKF